MSSLMDTNAEFTLTEEQQAQVDKTISLIGDFYKTLGNPEPDIFPKDDEILDGWIVFALTNRVVSVQCNSKMTWGEGFTSRVSTDVYSTKLKALSALLKLKKTQLESEILDIENQIKEESKVFLKDIF